jgi:hypothetical protein
VAHGALRTAAGEHGHAEHQNATRCRRDPAPSGRAEKHSFRLSPFARAGGKAPPYPLRQVRIRPCPEVQGRGTEAGRRRR